MNMGLDRSEIERALPHGGSMCLLEEVVAWDGDRISCIASPDRKDHPLARPGGIPTIMAAEYAAQATAVHGALLEATGEPRPGLLAMLKNVTLHEPWLTGNGEQLTVDATLIGRSESGCIYSFSVRAGNQPLSDGQLMVAFRDRSP